MFHEPPFGLNHQLTRTKTYQTRCYPIDVELRRAFRARRGRRRGLPIHALAARLRNGTER